MTDYPKKGDLFDGRWRVLKRLGSGAISTVLEVRDEQSGRRCALKLLAKGFSDRFREYTDHLLELQRTLSGVSAWQLSVPHYVGETETFVYQITDLIEPSPNPLSALIEETAPMDPTEALQITVQVVTAIRLLSDKNIIHGDIKPENILTTETDKRRVYLIDFGMAQRVEQGQNSLLVGTYRYMHPSLRGRFSSVTDSNVERVKLRAQVGVFVDIYALGVVMLQMLTREFEPPRLLSIQTLSRLLEQRSPYLRYASKAILNQLVSLLCSMLATNPAEIPSPQQVLESCTLILEKLKQEPGPSKDKLQVFLHTTAETIERPTSEAALSIDDALGSLRAVADSLAESTRMMLRSVESLQVISKPEQDSELLHEMDSAFSNALARTRASWRIGVTFSTLCFALILGMVVCAVTLAITTKEATWSLIFGGASVPMIIGTILWRPYDRIFRATILAQQMEMIHVQTSTAFRSTANIERRIELCREAIGQLETLFRQHESTSAHGRQVS